MIHLRYLLLCIALALASKAPAQCRSCSAPTIHQAAPVSIPAAASPARGGPLANGVIPAPVESALADEVLVLSRRIAKLANQVRAMRKAKVGSVCVDGCGCTRCGERCPCREGGGRCGSGCSCVVAADEKLPTGVDASKLSAEPRFTLDGRDISPAKGIRLIEGDGDRVPDDAGKVRVVIAGGTGAQRRAVLDDLSKAPPAIAEKFLPHAYPADSPLVKDRGLVATGAPSITVYRPGVPGVFRNKDGTYRGAESLYAAIEAVSKYDPAKDKDLWGGGGPIDWPALKKQMEKVPPAAWGIGGAVGAVLLLGGRKKEEK